MECLSWWSEIRLSQSIFSWVSMLHKVCIVRFIWLAWFTTIVLVQLSAHRNVTARDFHIIKKNNLKYLRYNVHFIFCNSKKMNDRFGFCLYLLLDWQKHFQKRQNYISEIQWVFTPSFLPIKSQTLQPIELPVLLIFRNCNPNP